MKIETVDLGNFTNEFLTTFSKKDLLEKAKSNSAKMTFFFAECFTIYLDQKTGSITDPFHNITEKKGLFTSCDIHMGAVLYPPIKIEITIKYLKEENGTRYIFYFGENKFECFFEEKKRNMSKNLMLVKAEELFVKYLIKDTTLLTRMDGVSYLGMKG